MLYPKLGSAYSRPLWADTFAIMAPGSASSSGKDAGTGKKLIEAAHEDEMKRVKVRPLKKRNTEDQVNRSLKDNFKEFRSAEIDSVEIDGMTLRQRLAHDKRLARKNPEMSLGANYYKMLKDKYRSSDSVMKKLEVLNHSEIIDQQLRKALIALNSGNCNKVMLMEYMSSVEKMNQKEVIGLYRGAQNLKPSMSQKRAQVLVDLMRMILRLKLNTNFVYETKLMLPLFDETLCSCWDRLKGGRVGPEEFWRLHGDIGSLVMIGTDVRSILDCGTNYKSVSEEVARCTTGCKLGIRMFDQAWLWVGIWLRTWGDSVTMVMWFDICMGKCIDVCMDICIDLGICMDMCMDVFGSV